MSSLLSHLTQGLSSRVALPLAGLALSTIVLLACQTIANTPNSAINTQLCTVWWAIGGDYVSCHRWQEEQSQSKSRLRIQQVGKCTLCIFCWRHLPDTRSFPSTYRIFKRLSEKTDSVFKVCKIISAFSFMNQQLIFHLYLLFEMFSSKGNRD